MKGLVLEGGAMRGMYTAGVLDVMMDAKVSFDMTVGVSAGALFGVNLHSAQRGRVIRYNKAYSGDFRYMGWFPLLTEGNLVGTRFAYDEVPLKRDPFDDEAFQKSGIPFYAVLTNVESGEPEYIQIQSVYRQMDALRASGSMPFVSRPVRYEGQYYLDGGITDSIPFEWAVAQGAEKMVVVLTRPEGYRKDPVNPKAAALYHKSHPAIERCLLERHTRYNASLETLKAWEKEGKAFVIRPSEPIAIHRTETNPEKLQEAYEQGIMDALRILPALKEYLGM